MGTADKALSIENLLYVVNDGEKDHVYLQNHLLNPIGIGFGHNPPTFYKVSLEFPYILFPPAIPMRKERRAVGAYDPRIFIVMRLIRVQCTMERFILCQFIRF